MRASWIGGELGFGSYPMPQADPARIVSPLIMPRPVTGHRRQVQISHASLGVYNLLTSSVGWAESFQPSYTNYVYNPPFGSKQQTVHSQGTQGITWNISGELSGSSLKLVDLMKSENRGTYFQYITMNQGLSDTYSFINTTGYSLPWSSFSLTGSGNNAVTFSLEGNSTSLPSFIPENLDVVYPDFPIPSWFSGNNFVLSWSLSHRVNLTPKWRNNSSPFPAYYRPGPSEYTIQVTTAVELIPHTVIRFGIGSVSLVEAVVTSRNRVMGESGAPPHYEVTSAGARVSDQQAYNPSVLVSILEGPSTAGFS
jgi:hypothetical protein